MNRDMRKFLKKLYKLDNMGVIFKEFNGKLISSEEAENLNLPEGYSIFNNDIYFEDEKIGKFEVFKEKSDEIELDEDDFEDLFDDENEDSYDDFDEENEDTIDFTKKKEETKEKKSEKTEENTKSEKDIEDTLDVEKDNKVTPLNKAGYHVKRFFGKNNNIDLDAPDTLDKDVNKQKDNNVVDEKDNNVVDQNTKTSTNNKKTSIFKRIGQTITYGIIKFFTNFNKKTHVDIPEDVMKDDKKEVNNNNKQTVNEDSKTNPNNKKQNAKTNNTNTSTNTQTKSNDKEKIEKMFSEIEIILREIDFIINNNTDINFEDFKERIINGKNKFQELFRKYANGENIDINDLMNLKGSLVVLKGEMELFIIENKQLNNEPDTKTNTDTKKPDKKVDDKKNPNIFTFNSIEDTKKQFEKYDKYESVEEKIKYYEEFLRTHDLSHPDDKGMKERMEQKLADLKAKYKDGGKTADNNNRTEQMAFYTQTSKGIDKEIDRIETERQIKLLQAKLDGKTMINLGLAEERKIDAKKAELLRLKKECLERKAAVNKYYEEQAARMTKALKR